MKAPLICEIFMTLFDFIGIVGVGLILLAYGGLQLGRLDPKSLSYSCLNASGAVLILISLFFSFNLASFIIECAWLAISVFGIVKALRTRRAV